jgi:hypothetical protein
MPDPPKQIDQFASHDLRQTCARLRDRTGAREAVEKVEAFVIERTQVDEIRNLGSTLIE